MSISCILLHGNYTKAETAYSPKVRTIVVIVGSIFFIIGMVAALERGFNSSLGKTGGSVAIALGGTTLALGLFFKAIPKEEEITPIVEPQPEPILTKDEAFCDSFIKEVLLSTPTDEEQRTREEQMTLFLQNNEEYVEKLMPLLQSHLSTKDIANIVTQYAFTNHPERIAIFYQKLTENNIDINKLHLVVRKLDSALELRILECLMRIKAIENPYERFREVFITAFHDFDTMSTSDFKAILDNGYGRFKVITILTSAITYQELSERDIHALWEIACNFKAQRDEKDTAYTLINKLLSFDLSSENLLAALHAVEDLILKNGSFRDVGFKILTDLFQHHGPNIPLSQFYNNYTDRSNCMTIQLINHLASQDQLNELDQIAQELLPKKQQWLHYTTLIEQRRIALCS